MQIKSLKISYYAQTTLVKSSKKFSSAGQRGIMRSLGGRRINKYEGYCSLDLRRILDFCLDKKNGVLESDIELMTAGTLMKNLDSLIKHVTVYR